MIKLSCAEVNCTGRLKRTREKYIMCSSPDMIDDMLQNASNWCDPPENKMSNIDIIEIMSQKDKIVQNKRSNDEDILDIEIS